MGFRNKDAEEETVSADVLMKECNVGDITNSIPVIGFEITTVRENRVDGIVGLNMILGIEHQSEKRWGKYYTH